MRFLVRRVECRDCRPWRDRSCRRGYRIAHIFNTSVGFARPRRDSRNIGLTRDCEKTASEEPSLRLHRSHPACGGVCRSRVDVLGETGPAGHGNSTPTSPVDADSLRCGGECYRLSALFLASATNSTRSTGIHRLGAASGVGWRGRIFTPAPCRMAHFPGCRDCDRKPHCIGPVTVGEQPINREGNIASQMTNRSSKVG